MAVNSRTLAQKILDRFPTAWAFDPDRFADKAWIPNEAVLIDEVWTPSVPNDYTYSALNTGATGGIEPAWPTVPGQTVVDGDITWECVEQPPNFKMILQMATGFVAAWQAGQTLPFTSPAGSPPAPVPHTHAIDPANLFDPATMISEVTVIPPLDPAKPWQVAKTWLDTFCTNLMVAMNTLITDSGDAGGAEGETHPLVVIPCAVPPALPGPSPVDMLVTPPIATIESSLIAAGATVGVSSGDYILFCQAFAIGLSEYLASDGETTPTIPLICTNIPHVHTFL